MIKAFNRAVGRVIVPSDAMSSFIEIFIAFDEELPENPAAAVRDRIRRARPLRAGSNIFKSGGIFFVIEKNTRHVTMVRKVADVSIHADWRYRQRVLGARITEQQASSPMRPSDCVGPISHNEMRKAVTVALIEGSHLSQEQRLAYNILSSERAVEHCGTIYLLGRQETVVTVLTAEQPPGE